MAAALPIHNVSSGQARAEEVLRDAEEALPVLFPVQAPRDVLGGLWSGIKCVLGGVLVGLAGLIAQPIEGAREEGVVGCFRGVGLGLLAGLFFAITGLCTGVFQTLRGVAATPRAICMAGRGWHWDAQNGTWTEPKAYSLLEEAEEVLVDGEPEPSETAERNDRTRPTRVADTFYYDQLGVATDASQQEIRRAYIQRSRQCHPDKTSEENAKERFQSISEAYQVLSDKQRRRNYDLHGRDGKGEGFIDAKVFFDVLLGADALAPYVGRLRITEVLGQMRWTGWASLFWHLGLGLAAEGSGSRPEPRGLYAFLDCEGHEQWSSFRRQLAEEPAAAEATGSRLLTEHFPGLEAMEATARRFVQALSEPHLSPQNVEDCLYGVVAALHVRGRVLHASGALHAALADWDLALRLLGKELGLDFLESTHWPLRSGELLEEMRTKQGARGRSRQRQWQRRPLRPRAAGQGPWALDPLQSLDRSFWARLVRPAPHGSRGEGQQGPAEAEVLQAPSQASQALEVLVYGYHPVLIEPISALLQFQDYADRLRLKWYGISARDCSFFAPLCEADTRREARKPVPAGLRWKVYESSLDEEEVLAAYDRFWESEKTRADLVLAMELRDAYFLWRVSEAATIYYAALIFLQDEAMSDYAAEVYLRQFDAFRENDVLKHLKLEGQGGQGGQGLGPNSAPTAMVAQSPYIAASIQYHTNQTLPCVRPLALYVGDNGYAPNRSGVSLLVLCARTRLMMSHACRGLFREGRRLLSRTGPRLFLPSGDRDVVHGLTFAEVATFHAAVLIPWNIAITTFSEFYALHLPIFVPDPLWLARLWPKQMTSYAKSHPNLHRQLRPNHKHPTPYPSLDSLATDFWIMLYWAENYGGIYEMPGVQQFASIPELLFSLKQKISENPLFLEMLSREMQAETQRAREEVLVFWRDLAGVLTASELFSGSGEDQSVSQQTQTRREVKLAISLASRLDAMHGPQALQEAKDEASGILQRDPSLARFLTEIGWVYANRADVYLASSGSLLGSWSVSALSSRASGHGHQASQQMRTAKLAAHSFVKLRRIVKEADEKEGGTTSASTGEELPESLSSALPTFMETFWSLSSHDITGTLDKVIGRVLSDGSVSLEERGLRPEPS
ncbi:DJP1 [Symbiodinium sp. KB8]|nr:DJP1 [Symbiodinium sp. KB8]